MFVERMVPMSKHTGERLGPGMKRHPGETEWVLSHDVLREKRTASLGPTLGAQEQPTQTLTLGTGALRVTQGKE